MMTGRIDRYVIIHPDKETFYMLTALAYRDRYSYYNIFLLDNDQDKWIFQRQVKCSYLHRTPKRTLYTLAWGIYYNMLPDTIEKANYLRILKFIEQKLKDGTIDESSYIQYGQGNQAKTNISHRK